MKTAVWELGKTISPELLRWHHARRFREFVDASFGSTQRMIRRRFYPRGEIPCVLSGPFQGLLYIDEIVWGLVPPKWLGAYESELADIVEQMVNRHYSRIINIGCAEGYYAAGLAFRDGGCEVYAFDTDPICRAQTGRLSRLNGLAERIHIYGECDANWLETVIDDRTVIICDIEGGEVPLLDPKAVPKLRQADLLVEIHGEATLGGAAQTEAAMRERFESSHTIERRASGDREPWAEEREALWKDRVSRAEILEALDEHRPEQQIWLWAKYR